MHNLLGGYFQVHPFFGGSWLLVSSNMEFVNPMNKFFHNVRIQISRPHLLTYPLLFWVIVLSFKWLFSEELVPTMGILMILPRSFVPISYIESRWLPSLEDIPILDFLQTLPISCTLISCIRLERKESHTWPSKGISTCSSRVWSIYFTTRNGSTMPFRPYGRSWFPNCNPMS
jgi:hypothetical protein